MSTHTHWRAALTKTMTHLNQEIKKHGRTGARFTIFRKNHADQIIEVPMDTDEKKAGACAYMKVKCIVERADALLFTDEAWSTVSTEVRPSKSDQRKEIVVAWLAYYDDSGARRTVAAEADLLRRASGHAVGLGPTRFLDDASGPMLEVLPDAQVTNPLLIRPLQLALDELEKDQREQTVN